ncbi:MAG: hypothetical protein D8M26_10965 [Ignavibacteriae bacterium]|nr:hypothetical protein [Ignavibacteriota bacterium]
MAMKYKIDKSDLFINNKLHSEGSEVELSEEEIIGIEEFLIPISEMNDSTKGVKPQLKLNSKGNKK